MQDKDNRGVIFNNADNPKAKTPYGGSAIVDGKEYWLNVWVDKTKDGRSYFSVKFAPKGGVRDPEVKQSIRDQLDDEIPF